ncbi:HAUS augmin-like complex subunit 8 [Rattus norvegicus]|uniref:HAUS augmin-like complex subunit 8 n=1 Tax=Rattus norvegicus TaxID=10116 RepID=HAUS8_RAT|nr:HAUS augmin-like complex subunit 8 [Rattus norvegicus]Q5BK57.2 RecName: Full=HAUS augmin-like complex subunit 8; AltName: Full=HEC1/NDC80-interacting centrosome-associated protein 1; AltName: Full=Sarcoma antigen NY-SAR-48 homolog [Rattus norvegicus]|eukprot:NP_001020142.2 HAUS augmin-like complex subunit 8 [Rattus norvegicus]
MAGASERDAGKPAASGAGAVPKTKGRKVQGGRVVESRYLQYDKKTKKVSVAAKGEKPPTEGRKASTVPRSREESKVMGTSNLQSTMLEGHGLNPPDLDLSAIDDKSMSRKAPQLERSVAGTDKSTSLLRPDQKRTLRKKRRDLQETMDMMESQTLLMTLLSVKVENNLALLEEKAEKDLAAMCHEKERLQRQALELRRQLLLRQKHQELAAALDAQTEVLSPLPPVLERFKEEYKTLGRALDTTRHELSMQAVHMEGSGQELLDDLEPALRTTLQLLGDLSICSPEDSAQVQGASTQQPGASAQLNCLLKELKGLVAEKDLELCRLVSQVVELSSQASKEAALTNQEVWEEAQGTLTSSQGYFSPDVRKDHSPTQDRTNSSSLDP